MLQRTLRLRPALFFCAGSAAMLLAGCADGGRTWAYRNNPSPETDTLGIAREEDTNRNVVLHDTNGRALNGDLSRLFLTDRPSRLAPQRVPY